MNKTRLTGLYAITDQSLMPDTATMLAAVELSLKGGAKIIQYRDKSSDHNKRLQQAKALVTLCRRFNAPLLINDDIELALKSGAQGVHLGQSDGQISEARRRLGEQAIIGMTCHDSLALAQQAQQQGADYIAFGAFFSSKTKPNAKPAPLSLLTTAKQQINLPIVAIGGISVDNADQVIAAGVDMVAVVHALYAQSDIHQSAQQFQALF